VTRRRPVDAGRAARGTPYYAVAIALVAVFLAPLVWAVLGSFKTEAEAAQSPPTWVPAHPSLGSYQAATQVGSGGIFQALANSAEVTVLSIALTVVVGTLAGYGFARFPFPAKDAVFALILLALMIPFQSILIPLFSLMSVLQLTNSLVGLALIYATFQVPFASYVMRNSFEQIPGEIAEAAVMDGCSSFQSLIRVMLPIALPGTVTVALFTFLAAWNELLAALVFLGDASKFTVPIILNLMTANLYGAVPWGALQAGIVMAMVPSLVVFLLLQRYYTAGLALGAVKG
jgi:multiple sugar transport system permease protein